MSRQIAAGTRLGTMRFDGGDKHLLTHDRKQLNVGYNGAIEAAV